jgi:hypothetical protein
MRAGLNKISKDIGATSNSRLWTGEIKQVPYATTTPRLCCGGCVFVTMQNALMNMVDKVYVNLQKSIRLNCLCHVNYTHVCINVSR